jgi:transposase
MTDEQKQQIIALRRDGAGYGRIAVQLQISINTVKSFCRRHSSGGESRQPQYVSSAESRLNRIRDGSGNGSAAMPAGISGGTHIWNW